MSDLDFNAVKPRLDGVAGANAEARDRRLNILLVHRLGVKMAGRLGHLGRCPQHTWRLFKRSVASMGKLAENARTMLVHGISNFREHGNDCGIPRIHETTRHLSGGVDRLTLEDDEPHAAPGPLFVISNVGS